MMTDGLKAEREPWSSREKKTRRDQIVWIHTATASPFLILPESINGLKTTRHRATKVSTD